MKFKSVVLLAVAIGCGLVAMLGVQQVMSGDKAAETKMVKVLVAIEEISPGVPLDETNVAFKELPEDMVPSGAETKQEQFAERALKRGAFPGDIITKAKLDENLIASYEIPQGMRVVTVSVNLTKTHSGLITPGDRVDVLVTYKARTAEDGLVTRTKAVLEYIQIFATDSLRRGGEASEGGEIKAKNISVLVSPD